MAATLGCPAPTSPPGSPTPGQLAAAATPGEHVLSPSLGPSQWKLRREMVGACVLADHLVVAFVLLATVGLSLYGHQDAYVTSILMTALVASFGRSVLVIGSFVFGAVWDDANFMRAITGRLHKEEDK